MNDLKESWQYGLGFYPIKNSFYWFKPCVMIVSVSAWWLDCMCSGTAAAPRRPPLLINPLTRAFIRSRAFIPPRSSEGLHAPGLWHCAFEQITLCGSSSYTELLSTHEYLFHSCIVEQLSKLSVFEGALHRFSGKAVKKHSLTHKYICNSAPSHSCTTERSTVGGVFINVAV